MRGEEIDLTQKYYELIYRPVVKMKMGEGSYESRGGGGLLSMHIHI